MGVYAIPSPPLNPAGFGNLNSRSTPQLIQQTDAPWNLQRISSRVTTVPINGNITGLTYTYRYDQASRGEGVDVYIVDSGVDFQHPEFEGRAKMILTIDPQGRGDASGHGTFVAGVVGSKSFGIAKNVNIFGAGINYGGDQDLVNSTRAIDAVIAHNKERRTRADFRGAVMNLSWGFDRSTLEASHAAGFSGFDNKTIDALRTAIRRASEAGIHITVTPGNDNADACDNFPATFVQDVPSLISVGNTDITDTRASNSGWGRCVDMYAPGSEVTSTFLLGFGVQEVNSGTSFAAPAVAGVIAGELIRRPDLMLKPQEMKKHILSIGMKGAVKDARGGGNVLLNTGIF
ncbi:hypothetical protein H072_2615 [Dactylellina haptotyla CBS 200.50]|uniref:Peptidase S8/S53 domain-containing protein n=1 Tax=Dactylellina haptotyla (strain CBS 200.50) TaxID=1284197 RepID=S8C6U4_DACHA|nr:hypothetical protein H072_2615 [Dactylellina haptotyla CBS 200.50]